MEKIASFRVDHLNLFAGLYLSRRDGKGDSTVSTYDLRMTAPNREPVLDMPAVHTIEHLGATYFRNSALKESVVYFGPMGCRTGFYLLLFGTREPKEILGEVLSFCEYVLAFEGEIPGARAEECGNYSEQNLPMAKYYIRRYYNELKEYGRLEYPHA